MHAAGTGTGKSTKVFISYRREDAVDIAGRIRDWLIKTQGVPRDDVFMDVTTILPGADFLQVIEEAISQCRAMIVVVSPSWLAQVNAPDISYVRLETEAALRRGLLVIPVLVGGAQMPPTGQLPEGLRPLTRRNARPVRSADFDYDMEWVGRALGGGPPAQQPQPAVQMPPATPLRPRPVRNPLLLAGAVVALVALAVGVLSQVPEGNPVWQVVHAHVIADASFVQQAGTAGWDNDGATCIPETDGYHVIHNAGCSAAPYGVDTLSTYTIAVSMREIGTDATNFYGLNFRYSSSAGGYQFLISSDGDVAVQIAIPGQPRRNLAGPPRSSSLINTGVSAVNRLEVRITGSHFAFVINGSVLEQLDDATFSSGSLGFSSLNANRVRDPNHVATDAERQTGDVVFTDFQITAPLFGA
jgi:hypothetical protein